jgi:hypothetical protein
MTGEREGGKWLVTPVTAIVARRRTAAPAITENIKCQKRRREQKKNEQNDSGKLAVHHHHR